jgi:molybdate transport system substrate-binding protein
LAALWLALAPALSVAQPLTVSAAASLTDAMREIGVHFEAARPGRIVRFNFAASGALLQQIVRGAPVDVFVSADPEAMNRGIDAKVIDPATRRDFASNSLVLVAPKQGAAPVASMADLTRPEVRRIAVGKPATVAAGRYAKQALERAQLWAALQPRLVLADHTRQALDYVARGEAEAGLVFLTDAESMKDKVRVVATGGGHLPIAYPVAVTVQTPQRAAAMAFIAFLFDERSQAILARHGFGKP